MPPSSSSSSPKRVGFSVFGKLDREWVRWHMAVYVDLGHHTEESSVSMS